MKEEKNNRYNGSVVGLRVVEGSDRVGSYWRVMGPLRARHEQAADDLQSLLGRRTDPASPSTCEECGIGFHAHAQTCSRWVYEGPPATNLNDAQHEFASRAAWGISDPSDVVTKEGSTSATNDGLPCRPFGCVAEHYAPEFVPRTSDASFQRDAEAWARADAAADQQRYDLMTARGILGEGSSLMLQWKVAQAILDAREEGRRSTDYPILRRVVVAADAYLNSGVILHATGSTAKATKELQEAVWAWRAEGGAK